VHAGLQFSVFIFKKHRIFDVTTLMAIDFDMPMIGKLSMFHCAEPKFSRDFVLENQRICDVTSLMTVDFGTAVIGK